MVALPYILQALRAQQAQVVADGGLGMRKGLQKPQNFRGDLGEWQVAARMALQRLFRAHPQLLNR